MDILRKSFKHCTRCLIKSQQGDLIRMYSQKWPRRILTGLQPTGALHVGNYFGAVRRCVQMQNSGDDLMVCIADMHSLTTHQNGKALQEQVLEMTAYLLASGLDPERCVLFAQSAVPRHAELCWILTCLATYARVAQLPQFKEKGLTQKEPGLGLLMYPVLQAADVLLYRATHVPVGADQLQHLQLAAHLARTFNLRYQCHVFPTPEPILPDDASVRLKSLKDPSKKMSKSDPNNKSRILLSDSNDVIRLKVRKAITDFTPQVTYDPELRPGVSNLISLHCLAADILPEEVVEESDALTTAQYKEVVSSALIKTIEPLRAKATELRADEAGLRAVLQAGALRAQARADITYEDIAAVTGLQYLCGTNIAKTHSARN